MAKKLKFSKAEWTKINNLAQASGEDFGLPYARSKSVVIGTFNIRKLGKKSNKSVQSWNFLEKILKRFDLIAVQEVMDYLEAIKFLRDSLGKDYGLIVSDVTGQFPGDRGNAERLAFLFNKKRIQQTELSSDITYDRSKIVNTLFENRTAFQKSLKEHLKKLTAWKKKAKAARELGKRPPKKPVIELPIFLTFIRQPHCASFQVTGKNNARPVNFLAVNAHLLYGEKDNMEERKWEFDALIAWLNLRAKNPKKMYHSNMILLGDCNLEFEKANIKRDDIDKELKNLNEKVLKNKKAAKVNFPLLSEHPVHGYLKTTARQKQTYDQIAVFARDKRLPSYKANAVAGKKGDDAYDYGVFNFTDLFAEALFSEKFDLLSKKNKDHIIKRCEHDISDHMPAWFRLPIPGA
jgi:endonuclease/exonuclease/phosphatase family metal-dependent hydrolase